MTNVNKILKLADSYYSFNKKAQDTQFNQYFTNAMQQMARLADWGLISVKHLTSQPKYANVKSLQTLEQSFTLISQKSKTAQPKFSKQAIDGLEGVIAHASFLSSKGNAGTGYEAVTSTKIDEYTPPSFYVASIDKIFRSLKSQYSSTYNQVPNA